MDYQAQYNHLLDLAESQGYSPQSGQYLEDAAHLALENSDDAGALLARYLYIYAVAPIEPEKALVAFTWCLSHKELAQIALPYGALAQLFGIVIGILRSYPVYTLEQIEATFAQMVDLYAEIGLGKRDLEHQRIYLALSLGRQEEAQEAFDAWSLCPPDTFSCPVCDRGTRVIYNLHRERFRVGLAAAEPFLNGGLRCDHGQPLVTCAASMVPLLRDHRLDEAARAFQTATQLLGELSYAGIWAAGRLLTYSALIGKTDAATETLIKHAPIALRRGTPTDRFGYLIACRALAKVMIEKGESAKRIEYLFPDSKGDPALLAEALQAEVLTLAGAFDRRNGNGEYTRITGMFDSIFDGIRDDLRD